MSSTLLDLQRLNLKKMEATEVLQGEPGEENPSNEVSIIPSRNQSNDVVKENVNTPSNEESIKASSAPSSDRVREILEETSIVSSQTAKPTARKRIASSASKAAVKKEDEQETPKDALREALNGHLRAHLMEQLLPLNGKGPVTRLNVEMPEDLHQHLKQHCVKTRTPIKALINALIALYLEAEGEA